MRNQILFPMALYVFYIGALALFMFRSRVRALKGGQASLKYFRSYSAETAPPPPEAVLVVGRHYDNQFQLPMLFLITCTLHIALGVAGYVSLVLAWIFVVSRFAHAWIHLGRNDVRKRAAAFGLGWLTIWAMWITMLFYVWA